MKTSESEDFPEIQWEQNKLMDYDTEERYHTWLMDGLGENGKLYSGIGEYSCGELVAITEIELK